MRPYYCSKHYDAIIDPMFIIEFVSEKLNIPVMDMLGKSRKLPVQDANRVATVLILENSRISIKDTGHVFNRDHSSIIVRRDRHEDLIITDKSYQKKFEMCKLLQKTNYHR